MTTMMTILKAVSKIFAPIEAADRVEDVCQYCNKEITYDKEDGYWDSFEREDENGHKYYTPMCGNSWQDADVKMHEPLNYERGDHGIYFKK